MRKILRHQESESSIDISPLIDMVFILLIFFMVSTTFVKDMKLDLDRPGAASSTAASSKAIRIYIDENSEIYIDGGQVRSWVVQSKIRELMQDELRKGILIVADKNVSAQKLVEVVDQCRLAGAKDIGVATRQEVEQT